MAKPDDNLYKTLLESTKAIPWKLNWDSKAFEYIGPQIEKLLGWPQDSWQSAQDWADRIHPNERADTFNMCVSQSECGIDHEMDYRALTADGGYVWVRDVVHVIREEGKTVALVGFMFDISERKKMEDVLLRLNRQLESLSYHDALTGIANRRMYDRSMKLAWEQAQQSQRPLSLALFDVDHFKDFNDHYGHSEGDACLKRVAQSLDNAALRPSDLLARYGGEEFILLMPDTSLEEAIEIAEVCRRMVANQQHPHAYSSASDVVTVSTGVASMIPEAKQPMTRLFEQADRMLYAAKQRGRNCIEAPGPRALDTLNS